MADPARKLSPEELRHNQETVQSIRKRQVDAIQKPKKPSLELLSSDEEPEEEEYEAPELTLEGDDEESDQENDLESIPDQLDLEENGSSAKSGGTPEEQIQQGQVPEYKSNDVFQPEAVGEELPGGPAVQPKRSKADQEKEQLQDAAKDKAGNAVKRGARQAAGKATDAAKKAAAEAFKKAAQAVAKFVTQTLAKLAAQAIAALAPYWLPILLIIIAIVIIVFGIIFLVRSLQTPNSNGSSPVQAADIINDHPLIQTVLALSSPVEFQKLLDSNKAKLVAQIDSFISELNRKYPTGSNAQAASTITTLEQVKTLIAAYNTPDAAKSAEIKTKLLAAIKPWSIALDPNKLIFPISGFNAGNPGRGSDYYTHNPDRPDHRGIDRGIDIGTALRAPADSEIVYLVENECRDNIDAGKYNDCNGGFGNTIIGKITAPGAKNGFFWEMHHIKKGSASVHGIQKGSAVKQGMIVALSGNNGSSTGAHLHFQVDKPEASRGGFPVGQGRKEQTIDPYEALGWSR